MSNVVYIEDGREQALRIIYGSKGYAKIQAQAKKLGLSYFEMLRYGEVLVSMGILCVDNNGVMNVFANQNGKVTKKRSS